MLVTIEMSSEHLHGRKGTARVAESRPAHDQQACHSVTLAERSCPQPGARRR